MIELKRDAGSLFTDYYVGFSADGQTKVVCILDDNCVRYSVLKKARTAWRTVVRREYGNEPKSKARCFQNATKALNE